MIASREERQTSAETRALNWHYQIFGSAQSWNVNSHFKPTKAWRINVSELLSFPGNWQLLKYTQTGFSDGRSKTRLLMLLRQNRNRLRDLFFFLGGSFFGCWCVIIIIFKAYRCWNCVWNQIALRTEFESGINLKARDLCERVGLRVRAAKSCGWCGELFSTEFRAETRFWRLQHGRFLVRRKLGLRVFLGSWYFRAIFVRYKYFWCSNRSSSTYLFVCSFIL